MIQAKKIQTRFAKYALLVAILVVPFFFAVPTVFAADSTANYNAFNNKLGSCPREGQSARGECVLKVAALYVDPYCKNSSNKQSCNDDWTKGYLAWFRSQIDSGAYTEAQLQNKIGATTYDTSNAACNGTSSQPSSCTQPYNASLCADRTGARPSFCDIPALTGDGIPNADDPTASLPVVDCRGDSESSGCGVRIDCVKGIDSDSCGITRLLIIVINVVSGIVGVLVVAVLVVAGIQYTTSAGDPNAAAAARKRASNALLALVLYGMMYAFLQWIVPGGVLQ